MYSAENRRRVALAITSTSLAIAPAANPLKELIPQSLLALYSKLLGGECLIHIGTEGDVLHV